MISFKEFMQVVQERVGDFGNPPRKTTIKCGPEGETTYLMSPTGKACKMKHKR